MEDEERSLLNILKCNFAIGEFCLDEIRQLYFLNILEDVVVICIPVQLLILRL